MKTILYPETETWDEILKRPMFDNTKLEESVMAVLTDVKNNGDQAIRKYTALFDKVNITNFAVTEAEITDAINQISDSIKKAIALAKGNIERFHANQMCCQKPVETTPGVKCWQKGIAIEKVGLYIPGGSAPLFSTVLMLGIPAQIAGCNQIVLCTPPNADGKIHPAILYTANLIGIKNIYKIGGTQAIAAMAYGTQTVPAVYKIFGPGNQYVMCAKQLVSRSEVAIDMPAGPSEVLVIADETSNPAFVAADLLSQAEHGPDSQVVVLTTSESVVAPIIAEVNKQLNELPRKAIAQQALTHSKFIVVKTETQLMQICNKYAPEHLIISVTEPERFANKVINAGSVFMGHLSPESAGDYASGTNHTLPTNGYARLYSGVNLDSFVKKVTFQQISEYGLFNIGPAIEQMAELEELHAHKNAVTIRLNSFLK